MADDKRPTKSSSSSHPMPHRPREELLDRNSIGTHQKSTIRLERVDKRGESELHITWAPV